jgi:tight adherence protein B
LGAPVTALAVLLAGVAAASAGRAVAAARVRAAVGARLGRRAGPPIGAVVALPFQAHRRVRSGVRDEVDALPDVVDAIARSLRAGVAPIDALRAGALVAPSRLAIQLDATASAAGRGVPFADAVDRWADEATGDGPRLVAAAIAVNAGTGGEPARALAGVADTLRERRALRREVRALSSQARLSAGVIAVAPAAFGLLAAGTDRATASLLLGTPLGLLCLVTGLALEAAGWRWMERIIGSVR